MISAPAQASCCQFLVRAQRELEDHHRQIRHRRVQVRAPELIVERGEQQRRRLAADARDRQQQARDDAAARGRVERRSWWCARDRRPLPAEESFMPCGTRFSMSSVVRT